MISCPECDSTNIQITNCPYNHNDATGGPTEIDYECYCEDCECEFEVTEETSITYSVNKHGKDYVE